MTRKFLVLLGFICYLFVSKAQPANNDCASAVNMTVDGALDCAEAASGANEQGGECITSWAGAGNSTMWYSFDATNDSLVLNFVETNAAAPFLRVYGPFAPGGGCIPACASAIYSAQQVGDPGHHILLTGLSTPPANNHYLVQIDAADPNGPSNSALEFCININTPATNATASGATLIDECGTAFSNTTNGGYYQAGTSIGFNNLDGNNGTTCGTCGQAGDDTPFVINNVSWSTFCSLTAGTWQITVNGISGCNLAAPNAGIQASVFTGTSGSLTNQGNSASPLAPGASYTSPTITVNAGECAFLMIDGFAGDACNYSVTLTNITGGCVILPVGFAGLNIYQNENNVELSWDVYSETDNAFFTIERSFNGSDFTEVTRVPSIGNHSHLHTYTTQDRIIGAESIYYRLTSTDMNGEMTVLTVKYIQGDIESDPDHFLVYPNPVSDFVNIEFNNPLAEASATVQIYNTTGTVYQINTYEALHGMNNISVDLNSLPAGNYIIRVTTPYATHTEKILKQSK